MQLVQRPRIDDTTSICTGYDVEADDLHFHALSNMQQSFHEWWPNRLMLIASVQIEVVGTSIQVRHLACKTSAAETKRHGWIACNLCCKAATSVCQQVCMLSCCRQGDPIPIPCPDRKLEHLVVATSKPILSF